MIIRQETKVDFDCIYNLIKIAFKTAKVSSGTEQDFANQLRSSKNYIPSLALVAVERGDIIGHIMLTKFQVKCEDDGCNFNTLLVAPLSVKLDYRSQGIGGKLIKNSLQIAVEQNFSSVLLVGDPAYYQRFGFKSSIEYGISNTSGIPDENVMIKELNMGSLDGIKGSVSF